MKINSINNTTFKGTWTYSYTKKSYDQAIADYKPKDATVYLVNKIYHPFKDEIISDKITSQANNTSGKLYTEFDNNDHFLHRQRAITIEKVFIGDRLDITTDEYNALEEDKRKGEEAVKKLDTLGRSDNQFVCIHEKECATESSLFHFQKKK